MILYLLVLVFIMNPSNNFPCNFLQIDVLYHGPPVNQSEFCMPFNILILHDFQLSITYQYGVLWIVENHDELKYYMAYKIQIG